MIRRLVRWFGRRRKKPPVITFPVSPSPIKGMERPDWDRINAWGRRNAQAIAAAQARCQKVQVQ